MNLHGFIYTLSAFCLTHIFQSNEGPIGGVSVNEKKGKQLATGSETTPLDRMKSEKSSALMPDLHSSDGYHKCRSFLPSSLRKITR